MKAIYIVKCVRLSAPTFLATKNEARFSWNAGMHAHKGLYATSDHSNWPSMTPRLLHGRPHLSGGSADAKHTSLRFHNGLEMKIGDGDGLRTRGALPKGTTRK